MTPATYALRTQRPFHLGDCPLSAAQLADLLVHDPQEVAAVIRERGFGAQLPTPVATAIRRTALDEVVGVVSVDDESAAVAMADGGLIEAALVIAAVGTLIAMKAGYDLGKGDARQECAQDSASSGGDTGDTGDTGATGAAGPGAQDGGDGEGP